MTFKYDAESDMLYIELMPGGSTESEEVAPGVVLDYDIANRVVGIEIEDASRVVDLSRLEVSAVPLADLIVSNTQAPISQPD